EGSAADDRLTLLDALEADLARVFATTGPGPAPPLGAALRPVVRAHGLTPEPIRALIPAHRQDQQVTRYETWHDLAANCELTANPVDHLDLGLTGTLTPERER
ncbi:squalene/phytoene synthase family protein, partial [Streptomyces sp. JV186]|uniref:squalene/phytoene synthase family protein n=1 Tax=Streptomyces sp. JV186 TaxID=858639 RepID=UPI002E767F2A